MQTIDASRRRVLGLALGAALLGVGLAALWVGLGGNERAVVPTAPGAGGVPAVSASGIELAAAEVDTPAARVVAPIAPARSSARVVPAKRGRATAVRGGSLRGQVALRGGPGIPLDQVRVDLSKSDHPPEFVQGLEHYARNLTPDATGSFETRDLALGTWRVSASAPGYRTHALEVLLDEESPHTELAFDLARNWKLLVRLADQRTGAELGACDPLPDDLRPLVPFAILADAGCVPVLGEPLPRACTTITSRGRLFGRERQPAWLEFALDTEEDVWVGARHSGRVVAAQRVAHGTPLVHLVLDRESLKQCMPQVRVRLRCRQGGAPIAGAQVTLKQPSELARTGASDANGELTFRDVVTDSPELTAEAPGYLPLTQRVAAHSGEPEPADLYLDLARTVRGRLVDPLGLGVAALIRLRPVNGAARLRGESLEVRSAADGTFEFAAVRPGEFFVMGTTLGADRMSRLRCDALEGLTEVACADTRHGSVVGVWLALRAP